MKKQSINQTGSGGGVPEKPPRKESPKPTSKKPKK